RCAEPTSPPLMIVDMPRMVLPHQSQGRRADAPATAPRLRRDLGEWVSDPEQERDPLALRVDLIAFAFEDRHDPLEADREAASRNVLTEQSAHHPVVAAATRDGPAVVSVRRLEDRAGVIPHSPDQRRVEAHREAIAGLLPTRSQNGAQALDPAPRRRAGLPQ